MFPKEAIVPFAPATNPLLLRKSETPVTRTLDGAVPPPDWIPMLLFPEVEFAILTTAMPEFACAKNPTWLLPDAALSLIEKRVKSCAETPFELLSKRELSIETCTYVPLPMALRPFPALA